MELQTKPTKTGKKIQLTSIRFINNNQQIMIIDVLKE